MVACIFLQSFVSDIYKKFSCDVVKFGLYMKWEGFSKHSISEMTPSSLKLEKAKTVMGMSLFTGNHVI